MKTTKFFFLTLLTALIFTSCKTEHNTFITWPMVDATLNASTLFTSTQNPILGQKATKLDNNTKLSLAKGVVASKGPQTIAATMQSVTDEFAFPEYLHTIPTKFTAYFIATDGSDRNQHVVTIADITEGTHKIKVPARPLKVIVTNYTYNYTADNNNRIRLPENSTSLYLYGETDVDFSKVTNATVTATNDYAAILFYKNEVLKSVPQVNGMSFVNTATYYVGYLRDQNGGTKFNRNIQLNVLKRDGSVQNYNVNDQFVSNTNHYYLFKTTGTFDGDFTVVVADDILKNNKDNVIITQ